MRLQCVGWALFLAASCSAPPTDPPAPAHEAVDASEASADPSPELDAWPEAPDSTGQADIDPHDAPLGDAAPVDVALEPDLPPPFEPPVGEWQTLQPMPEPRAEATIAAHGGRLFVVGGVGADTVLSYTILADAWDEGAAMSVARYLAGLGVVGGQLYAVGGREAQGAGWQALGTVERYNPGANAWKETYANPEAGCCMASASVGERVWLFGGRNASTLTQSFDPAQGLWQKHAAMPVGRSRHAAALLESRVVMVGGLAGDDPDDGVSVLTRVDIYDTLSNTWLEAPEAPFATWSAAAATHGGRVWVLGGADPEGQPTAAVWVLDPDLGWAKAADMPRGRLGHVAQVVDDVLYVTGGSVDSAPMDAFLF